jgi:tRNA threonylcarbamoyladenosine biosynthesis protein TsaE
MILATPEATEALGGRLAAGLQRGDVIALFGDLGAGKTTLSRGLLRGLGFAGDVGSPTFPIVLTYEDLRIPLWHVDLYRIDDPSEIDELALDEALQDRLWRHALRLHLVVADSGARALTATIPPAWENRWVQ